MINNCYNDFIKSKADIIAENHQHETKIKIILNEQKDLEDPLELLVFKKTSLVHDKHQRKRRKKRYYNLALMAKIENKTTQEEVKRLLKNNTRTFLIDLVTNKFHQAEGLTDLIRQTVNKEQCEEPKIKLTIALALQITGDACRVGRIRNNCPFDLDRGNTMTLTTDTAYRFVSFKEIVFVINLQHYLPYMEINDKISIGHEVRAIVIKKFKAAVVIRIENIGIVSSYDLVELPNHCDNVEVAALNDIFRQDLELATKLQVDFICLPYIRCLSSLKFLKTKLLTEYKFKLMGCIDGECIRRKMSDLSDVIINLDFVWLTNLFSGDETLNRNLIQDVIPLARSLKKSIIGSIPLERYNDFKLYENHEFLWKIDCMFVEKSLWCNKYPLIVKKLLPIKNYGATIVESTEHHSFYNLSSMVHFIIRAINSIECQAIFLHTKCEMIAIALSRTDIYCPVYIMIALEQFPQETDCLIELTKNLNLRKNLRPIPFSKDMNKFEYKPIDYGIEYVRQCGCFETGDFIITLEVGKESADGHVQLGVNDDTVLMQTIYMPPSNIGETFTCT